MKKIKIDQLQQIRTYFAANWGEQPYFFSSQDLLIFNYRIAVFKTAQHYPIKTSFQISSLLFPYYSITETHLSFKPINSQFSQLVIQTNYFLLHVMNISGKQNLQTSLSKLLIKRETMPNKSMLTPRSSENQKQMQDHKQPSVQEINNSILEQELARVRALYEKQQNQKWKIIHERNSLENNLKVFDAERMNALGENEKLRGQIKVMVTKTDQLNSEKVSLLNEVHQMKSNERVMKSRIQNLEEAVERQRKNRQQYCSQSLDNKILERRIAELDLDIENLRAQNIQLSQNLTKLQMQQKNVPHFPDQNAQLRTQLQIASKENKILQEQLKMKDHEVEIQKKVFLQEKEKLLEKSAQLEEYVNIQRKQFETTSRKLKEIHQISENQNKKLLRSISTQLTSSLTFGKAGEDRELENLREQCYQKELRINHLSKEVLDLQRVIKEIQNVKSYNQHSSDSNIYSSLRLRDCFKSATTSMTPKQFNLYNEIQVKKLRIEELENQNRALLERLEQQNL